MSHTPGHMSPEMEAAARDMGIDPSELGAGFADPNNPAIYLGEHQTVPPTGEFVGPYREPPGFEGLGPEFGVEDNVSDLNTLLSELFTMNETRLRDLQRSLLDGGFYAVAPENVGWGTPDEHTVNAYSTALNRAGTYLAAGVKKTPREVIAEAAKARLEAEEEFRQGVAGGGNVYSINLSDPASLRRVADRISSEVLGRKADPEMEAKIASAIRSAQASEQGKANQAQESARRRSFDAEVAAQTGGQSGYVPPTTVTQEAVDPEARAEEMLRSEFPLEAAGMEGADGYRSFLGLLAPGGIR